MVLRLEQNLCLLRICSKNGNTISDRLRVRFRQCINPRFPNKPKPLCWQIHSHCVHPYNASNTKNFLPNPALCLILMEKPSHYLSTHNSQPTTFYYPRPKPLHFLMEAIRLRLASIFPLLAR
ncbi:hypothetical protein D3C80_1206620 [compost metagenome]